MQQNKIFIMHRLISLLLLTLQLVYPSNAHAETISVVDDNGTEIIIEQMQADGDLLVIWLIDHDEERTMFETMLQNVHKAGTSIWRVDLLDAYFLPRSSENIRTLSGEGVAVLIKEAMRRTNKKILLAAYDRMPLPLLRGMHLWQSNNTPDSRLTGAILFYPNLFGPPPDAGHAPELDPIVYATNLPVTIFQPENGTHRWRLPQLMDAFWDAGAPAYSYIVPEVRDWFFMHESGKSPAEDVATAKVPMLIHSFAEHMGKYPVPNQPLQIPNQAKTEKTIYSLKPLAQKIDVPPYELYDISGKRFNANNKTGQVKLISFWASWCPPCVEELPSMNRLLKHYADKPFEIISIDFRESKEDIRAFLKDVPVDFPVLLDSDGKTSLAWKVFSFPSSFLVDHNNHIRYSVNRAIDWDNEEVYQIIDQMISAAEK